MKIITINNRKIELTNLEKDFFPEAGLTKDDIIKYYQKIWEYAGKYVKDRPIVLQRFPDGVSGNGFYQKQIPEYFPDWIERITVENKQDNSIHELVNCTNQETLVYLANQAALSFHIWLSTKNDLYVPDKLVFDLDPSDDNFKKVVDSAKIILKLLKEGGFESYPMLTGSKGLHVILPIRPQENFDAVRSLSRKIAEIVVKKAPDICTLETRIDKRGSKVFIDYVRNSYAQTSVMPYSVRAVPNASVVTPVEWDEIQKADFDSQKYHVKNIFRRIAQKPDPWKEYGKNPAAFNNLKNYLENK